MKTLAPSAYQKAVDFLQHHARPLERSLYAFYFSGAPAENVVRELAAFQNPDGGFGHGLEPDSRLNDSSVIATTLAFQRFRELRLPADHPLVVKGCGFLVNTYEMGRINWPIIPPNIDDAPHAPWWVNGGDLEKSLANPRAEIAGYLHDYPEHFPAEMRENVTRSVLEYLAAQPDQMEMHDLFCYIRLSETLNLPASAKTALASKLRQIVENTVERSPAAWKNYGLPPLAVIASPDSPFAALFRDEVPLNLNFIIENQADDGTWRPNWSWGGLWPEVWEQAAQEWTGVMTLDNLRTLRTFGRIA